MRFFKIFFREPGLLPKEAIVCVIKNLSIDKKIRKNLLKVRIFFHTQTKTNLKADEIYF